MRTTTRRLAAAGLALTTVLAAGACGGDAELPEGDTQPNVEVGAGEAGVDAETGAGGGEDPFQPEDDLVEPGDADNVTEPDDLTNVPEEVVDEPAGLEDSEDAP